MKNFNITTEKASMPNVTPVTWVNRKLLYSLCAALFLLTCSLSTKAQNSGGTGDGTPTDLYILADTLGFSGTHKTFFQDSQCTSCSPLSNDYGSTWDSGADKWIQLTVADDGYLSIQGGTADFDSVFYLFNSDWELIASGDDGHGAGDANADTGHDALQPLIEYYASAGTYYLIVDGTDKYISPTSYWQSPSGTVLVDFSLSH